MALLPLADVIDAEIQRAGPPLPRTKTVPPLQALRRAGRELDVVCPGQGRHPLVLVDGDRAGFLTAVLDRTVVVGYPDGQREAVRVDRVQVQAEDVLWRDTGLRAWNDRPAVAPRAHEESRARGQSRARDRERARRVRKAKPRPELLPGIGTTEAAELAGVSKQSVDAWARTGRLAYTTHVVGTRTVRRVRREDVLTLRKTPAMSAAP